MPPGQGYSEEKARAIYNDFINQGGDPQSTNIVEIMAGRLPGGGMSGGVGGQGSQPSGMSQDEIMRALLTGKVGYQDAAMRLGEVGMTQQHGTPHALTALEGLLGSAREGAPPSPPGPPVGGYMPLTGSADDLFMGLVNGLVDPAQQETLMRALLGGMKKSGVTTPAVDRAISGR